MTLKYVVPGYPFPTLWFGVSNVVANAMIMLRLVVSAAVNLVRRNRTLMLTIARWFSGYPRTWTTTTPTISLFEVLSMVAK